MCFNPSANSYTVSAPLTDFCNAIASRPITDFPGVLPQVLATAEPSTEQPRVAGRGTA